MKNIFITLTFLMNFCMLLIFSGCSDKKEHNSKELNPIHGDMFNNRIKEGAKTIDLNEVVNFNWDRACIAAPYMSLDEVEFMLGFNYPEYDLNLEETWGIIFTSEKNVIGAITIDRYKVIDYFKDNNTEHFCLTRDQPVMHVVDKRGRPALRPIQK